jgi:hypothetical protein
MFPNFASPVHKPSKLHPVRCAWRLPSPGAHPSFQAQREASGVLTGMRLRESDSLNVKSTSTLIPDPGLQFAALVPLSPVYFAELSSPPISKKGFSNQDLKKTADLAPFFQRKRIRRAIECLRPHTLVPQTRKEFFIFFLLFLCLFFFSSLFLVRAPFLGTIPSSSMSDVTSLSLQRRTH